MRRWNAWGNEDSEYTMELSDSLREVLEALVGKSAGLTMAGLAEVVAAVVQLFCGIEVVPVLAVHGNSHRLRIAIVQTVEFLRLLERVRIVDIRIVVEPLPVGRLAWRCGVR